jgi:hypothetical protein
VYFTSVGLLPLLSMTKVMTTAPHQAPGTPQVYASDWAVAASPPSAAQVLVAYLAERK